MEGEEICTHVTTHTFDERATCRNITLDLCCRKYFSEKLPCLSFISNGNHRLLYQGKAAPLFVCPAQRQGIFLLEGGGNFWHNFNLWRANGQWSINVVFVTQPLKIDIPKPDRYDECQVYTSCRGRNTKKDQSADQHWSHLALGSPEPVTCRAPAWSRYRNMRRLKKWPFTQSSGFCLPKG